MESTYRNPNLSTGQFQTFMFAPAGYLASEAVHHRDLGWHDRDDAPVHDDTVENLAARKVREARRDGSRYDSIAREGVREPVTLYKPDDGVSENPDARPEMFDGHHRTFSQADINPTAEVPVTWYDPWISR